MGSSNSKGTRTSSHPGSLRRESGQHASSSSQTPQTPAEILARSVYARHGSGRGSRHDLSFLTLGSSRDREAEAAAPERPRETKQEREARRAERERQARLKERERSMREEHVDGGYLVTLGTYVGLEDYSKPTVRQLQIERRLAPFWKGLDDHSESWTEAQLVAAVKGLPIPSADAIPQDMARTASQASSDPRSSDANVNSLAVPIPGRSQSYQDDGSANLSASHPAFSSGPSLSTSATSTGAQLLRGRAKTLASLATGKARESPDLTPQEIRLPRDPYVHGQSVEAYLYKDAAECPICFLYYPPHLNRTRCCDQQICSECFVQIKRPDPHPPEHEQPGQTRPPEEEAESLVSEIAVCPFCVTPDFGVTYEPPHFRRGLAYANMHSGNPLKSQSSAMSSTTSLPGGSSARRRATSLSANAPNVITTDRIRPDWAKKLSDARAKALRSSATATALHNAAFVLGAQEGSSRGVLLGRRRRTLFGGSPGTAGGSPRGAEGDGHGGDDSNSGGDNAGGSGSRGTRVEDLEDLMLAEAIRLSLAAEEERKRKEEKVEAKEAKKRAKEAKKEEKKAGKVARRSQGGSSASLYQDGMEESGGSGSWGVPGAEREGSGFGHSPAATIPEERMQGKGKQAAQDFADFNPIEEPTSTLNEGRERTSSSPSPAAPPQIPASQLPPSTPIPATSNPHRTPQHHFRQLSNASSAASSFMDSPPGSYRDHSNLHSTTGLSSTAPAAAATGESLFNFRSLAEMVDRDLLEKSDGEGEHVEHLTATAPAVEGNRSRGDSGESSHSSPPPGYVEDEDAITPAPQVRVVHDLDRKEVAGVEVLGHGHTGLQHGRTQ